jgi:hypothetical protein
MISKVREADAVNGERSKKKPAKGSPTPAGAGDESEDVPF